MKPLTNLLKSLKRYELVGKEDWNITEVLFDSRKIAAGADGETQLYVAQKGTQTDGHQYIPQVIAQGGRVIVCEDLPETVDPEVTYVKVPDSSYALGVVASAFYDNPSRKLKLVGITDVVFGWFNIDCDDS